MSVKQQPIEVINYIESNPEFSERFHCFANYETKTEEFLGGVYKWFNFNSADDIHNLLTEYSSEFESVEEAAEFLIIINEELILLDQAAALIANWIRKNTRVWVDKVRFGWTTTLQAYGPEIQTHLNGNPYTIYIGCSANNLYKNIRTDGLDVDLSKLKVRVYVGNTDLNFNTTIDTLPKVVCEKFKKTVDK